MKRSYLKGLGLNQEQIDAIMEENGNDIENAKERAQEKHETIVEKLQDKLTVLEDKVKNNPKTKIDNKEDEDVSEIEKLKSELEKLKSSGKAKEGKKDDDMPKAEDEDNKEEDPLKKLQAEFEAYKANVELEKINSTKTNLLTKSLQAKGANPKLVPLLMKEFDLSKIELEGENDAVTIKGFDDMIKPIQENYVDIFGKVDEKGADVANPPKGKTSADADPKNIKEALLQKYNKT